MINAEAILNVAKRYNEAGDDQITQEIVTTLQHSATIARDAENPETAVANYLLGLLNDPEVPESYIEVVKSVNHLIELV